MGNLYELNFKQLGWILNLKLQVHWDIKQKFLLDCFSPGLK